MHISVLNKTAAIIKYNNVHKISKFLVPSSDNTTLCGLKSVLDGGTGYEIKYYFIILYNKPTNAHNYFTNYHTATCFDTIVSSSDSL